jgi:Uncharacterized protein conserved in bacteria
MSMLLAGGLLVGSALAALPVAAMDAPKAAGTKAQSAKKIQVEAPWVREAPPGARVLGAYMTLVNGSEQADRLLSVSSPLAGEIEIHRMTVKNGMMDMEAIPFLTVPAKGEVKLQPGGNHLMIYGMKRELKEGDRLPLELKFEHAGTLSIDVPVRKVMGKSSH